jgi:6,7-dimethyl-8-ribityllumazine synthase
MKLPISASVRIAIVVSQFNSDITEGLLRGAKARLAEDDVSISEEDIIEAPGAFELPLLAQTLGQIGRYDGIVCLGCVIKGETAHFEYISQAASLGIMMASLSIERPVSFGVLTTYTDEQAIARSRDDVQNKGREATEACLHAIAIRRRILGLTPRVGAARPNHVIAAT